MNDEARPLTWEGRYVSADAVGEGDLLSLTFPITETEIEGRPYGPPFDTMIGNVKYNSLVFKGNTLVHISPEGINYPLYDRERYRQSEPGWRKVERFVSDESVNWKGFWKRK